MSKVEVKNLDIDTLKFASQIAWGYSATCKQTKEGRTQAAAFERVQRTIEHYIKEVEKLNSTGTEQEVIAVRKTI